MPLVRGRILPEVELAGRAKRGLDVLVWLSTLSDQDMRALDNLEVLRIYLDSMTLREAEIRLWVPAHLIQTMKALVELGVNFAPIAVKPADQKLRDRLKADGEMSDAVSTALAVDADCLVTDHADWFPFIEDVEKLWILMMDCGFLLRYAEVFVRGHDIPWSFQYQVWNQPWNTFYVFAEQHTFKPGIDLLHCAFSKGASAEAQETGRSLVYNRTTNLCFTRDRLEFYGIQRLASRRNGWKRQEFGFEIPYYLNVFYLLIYGAFDHAALFVSQLLNLGLSPRQVGATYKGFLEKLETKSPSVHAVFTSQTNTEFMERVGALRHFAAHRGSITPTKVVEKLDPEPTVEELDARIKASGRDDLETMLPEGKEREEFRAMARSIARAEIFEEKTILEDVVPIEINGKSYFIHPLTDTEWNFSRTLAFLNAIFNECSGCI
jgi:hypothetical protein